MVGVPNIDLAPTIRDALMLVLIMNESQSFVFLSSGFYVPSNRWYVVNIETLQVCFVTLAFIGPPGSSPPNEQVK